MRKTYSRPLLVAVALAALLMAGLASARAVGAPDVADRSTPSESAEEIEALNIMSQSAWTYAAGPGGVLGSGHRSAYIGYDRNGNALEQATFNEDGSILQRIVNTCDDSGFLLESVSENQTGEGDARSVFEYDADRIVATTSYRPDGSLLVATSYEYNADGLVTNALTEVPDAGISQTMIFEYDAEGNAVSTVNYDSDGNVLASTQTSLDEEGRPIESTALLPDGTVGSVTSVTYDSDGRAASTVVRNAAGVILQTVSNVYDASGKAVETTTATPAAGIEYRVTVEYDEEGKRVIERTYNKLGELVSETRYVYEFYSDEPDSD
ncbi:hypothetical protein KAW64_05095 [bacterium]|nr:hypothetical protein [bacterium]